MNAFPTPRFILACTVLLAAGCTSSKTDDTADPADTSGADTDPGTDTTAPTVLANAPVDGELDVARNRVLRVTFSEALDPESVTSDSWMVTADGAPVDGATTVIDNVVTFTPTGSLGASTAYAVTLGTSVTDLAGNPLAAADTWSFTSGETSDTTPPTVLSTTPSDYATDVAVTREIRVTFDEFPDPTTIDGTTFFVQAGSSTVVGTVTLDGATATFTPSGALADTTLYDATVTDGVLDRAGNALAAPYGWSFTTASVSGAPGSIDLQSAADFAVLAGSTVTSTGLTVVNGNLGVSPGTAVDGFPPGVVAGVTYAGDPAAAEAELDLTTAYNDAAGRTLAPIVAAGNLGGQTLAPGLYTSDSSLEISSGDLTLDAGGDENAVWIFQMGSTFTTTSGRQVLLTGGAKAGNVYWQVGSSATLGSTSVMVGNLLADQSITLGTGATLEGRALTRIGAIALDSNVITLP